MVKKIIEAAGGRDNISSVTHCMTRLRFTLKDDAKAHLSALNNVDGVVKALFSGGMLQIVIGVNVVDVYEEVCAFLGKSAVTADIKSDIKEKKKPFAAFISVITGVFSPILGVLSATGLIKGVIMVLVALGVLSENSGTYTILYNAADSLFYFFPIVIGYTAAKKFALNEITGLMLGFALCAPSIVNIAPSAISIAAGQAIEPMGEIFGLKYYTTLFGVPVIFPASGNYTSSVVPIIVVTYFASIIERFLKKHIPCEIKRFAVPLVTFVVSLSLGLLVLGPVATIATDAIGYFTVFIFNHFSLLGGAFVGGFWQVLVILGLHWSFVPLHFINLASKGFDMVMTPFFPASFACIAATLAVVIKSKDKQIKSIALPSLISAVVGITEPALYGITLPRQKPFVFSCIGSAIVGVILSATKSYMYIESGLGVFGFPSFIMTKEFACANNIPLDVAGGVVCAVVACAAAMLSTFMLTFFFYRENLFSPDVSFSNTNPAVSSEKKIYSVARGVVKKLSDIEDPAFSDNSLGFGIAIDPIEEEVYSPVDGVVSVLPQTCHAACIMGDNGEMILIHIGYNTASLLGEGFRAYVKEGDRVKKGEKIISFDLDGLKKKGYSLSIPVVIGNSEDFSRIELLKSEGEMVSAGDELFKIVP